MQPRKTCLAWLKPSGVQPSVLSAKGNCFTTFKRFTSRFSNDPKQHCLRRDDSQKGRKAEKYGRSYDVDLIKSQRPLNPDPGLHVFSSQFLAMKFLLCLGLGVASMVLAFRVQIALESPPFEESFETEGNIRRQRSATI